MKSFTTMVLLWALIPLALPAQKTLFKHYLNRYSYGFGISQLSNGDYLLAGSDEELRRALAAIYDLQGNLIWEDTLCNCSRYALIGLERNKGNYLFVLNWGKIVEVDSANKKADTILEVNEPGGRILTFDKVRTTEYQIYILGRAEYANQKTASVLIRMPLDSNQPILHKIYPDSIYVRDFHLFSDGTFIEYFETASREYLQKSDPSGRVIWNQPISAGIAFYSDILISSKNDVFLTGTVRDSSASLSHSGVLLRLDSDGNLIFQKRYPSNLGNLKIFSRIQEDASGDLLIAGSDGQVFIGPISEAALTKLNTDGQVLWEIREEIKFEGNMALDFILDADGNAVLTGIAGDSDFGGPQRAFIWKVSPLTIDAKQAEWPSINMTPNPASDNLILNAQEPIPECQITLYNIEGKSLYQERISRFPHSIDIRNWTDGLYFCKISNETGAQTLRWVKSAR